MPNGSSIPHSWSVSSWPATVFPGDPSRARYLLRHHRRELMEVGALARVGRTLVVFLRPYEKFLQRQTVRVPGFIPAPNRRRQVIG